MCCVVSTQVAQKSTHTTVYVSTDVMLTPEFNKNQYICIFRIQNVYRLCEGPYLSLLFDVAHTYWQATAEISHVNQSMSWACAYSLKNGTLVYPIYISGVN